MELRNVWVRIAANPKGFQQGSEYRWRCFIGESIEPIVLKTFSLSGYVNNKNYIPGSTGDEGVDPRAWISMYVDLVIDQGVANFTLVDPNDSV